MKKIVVISTCFLIAINFVLLTFTSVYADMCMSQVTVRCKQEGSKVCSVLLSCPSEEYVLKCKCTTTPKKECECEAECSGGANTWDKEKCPGSGGGDGDGDKPKPE